MKPGFYIGKFYLGSDIETAAMEASKILGEAGVRQLARDCLVEIYDSVENLAYDVVMGVWDGHSPFRWMLAIFASMEEEASKNGVAQFYDLMLVKGEPAVGYNTRGRRR